MSSATVRERVDAGRIFSVVIGAGLLLSLAANLPGHLSVDSVVALVEGRTEARQTWAPAISSWLIGRFDDLLSGTGLYVTATAALLYLTWASLPALRPRARWTGPVVALGVVLLPQVLVYQGIVWRDVLFANLGVAGFLFLAHAARRWPTGRMAPLLAAGVCLALAALVRQNGLVLVLAATVAVGWMARRGGRRAWLKWGAGFLAAVGVLAVGLDRVAQPRTTAVDLRPNVTALILQHYDIMGARAHDPAVRFDDIGAASPEARRILEARAAQVYSPSRIDTLDQDETVRRTLWAVPDPAMGAQWRDVILHHPGAYLAHRMDVFWWVLATPELDRCLPIHVGVDGPGVESLRMVAGVEPRDAVLGNYASWFYDTPLYSHLTYAAIALVLMVLLLRRGDPADAPVAALLGGALLFAASFLPISVACDYRYLYLVDVAALTGLLYFALDPTLKRRAF